RPRLCLPLSRAGSNLLLANFRLRAAPPTLPVRFCDSSCMPPGSAMHSSRKLLATAAVLFISFATLHHAAIAFGAPPDTVWVGFSSASSDPLKVAVGGRWTFEAGFTDSAQYWTSLQAPTASDANVYALPSQRPWWYLDY